MRVHIEMKEKSFTRVQSMFSIAFNKFEESDLFFFFF